MSAHLRIPMTAAQKRVVARAAAKDRSDVAAWVRPILLKAAQAKLDGRSASRQSSAEGWIGEAIDLAERGKKEESLDVIFDALDDLLLKSDFRGCDAALAAIAAEKLSNPQLLTALTATLPAKSRLKSREAFVKRVKSTLADRGADVAGLVSGLD